MRIPECGSSVVELWFAAADFPKSAVGADVVAKAALLALLRDLWLSPRAAVAKAMACQGFVETLNRPQDGFVQRRIEALNC